MNRSFKGRLASAVAGLAFAATAAIGAVSSAQSAGAIAVPPGGYHVPSCVHLVGTPDPCPPDHTHPDPITDPTCLRVDVEPLHCPYLP